MLQETHTCKTLENNIQQNGEVKFGFYMDKQIQKGLQ